MWDLLDCDCVVGEFTWCWLWLIVLARPGWFVEWVLVLLVVAGFV